MARTKWWVKHPIQTKYLITVIAAMLAPALVLSCGLYHLIFYLLSRQIAFPEAIFANIVPVINRVNALILFTLPPIFVLMAWLAVAISHRFAGPIERLETELDLILAGDTRRRLQVRQGDDLTVVADKVNRLLDQIKK